MKSSWFKSILPVLLALASAGAGAATQQRPNILFVISDDQSWVHTSIAGDPVVKTPNFDRIATEGLLFNNSYTACPSCAPSRAAVLTGQNFWRLEEGGLLFGCLRNKFKLYTKILEESGYTVGKTGKGYAPASQRFDTTWKEPCGKSWNKRYPQKPFRGISNTDYAASFSDFMNARNPDKPFCFWVGAIEPHRIYDTGIGEKNGIDPAEVTVPPFLPDSPEVRGDIADYLFEIQWYDQHLGRILKTLDEQGELDSTLIVVTSDNGMPFPRAKATAYNYGVHMPLAIRWGNGINKPGRRIDDFVNHIDFAPTFLEAAGLPIPREMTGKSLMNLFQSDKEGFVDPQRTMTVTGLERHVWTRPGGACFPRRVIHTKDYVYIRNYEPDRWPMGSETFTPSHGKNYGDIDASPTKEFMLEHRNSSAVQELFSLGFGKVPAEELYAIDKDPAQLKNLAGNPEYQSIMLKLRRKMEGYQKTTADPRIGGKAPWENYPFYSGRKKELK
jgi:uncharacterized sulfatase